MNTDSGDEEHVLSNKGTLTALTGVMGKTVEFCPLFYYPACRRVFTKTIGSPQEFLPLKCTQKALFKSRLCL